MPVHEHNVDQDKGNGSRSEMEDTKTGDIFETKDQRADTRTTFYKSDIDRLNVSERRKRELKRALRRQEGENQGEAYFEDRNDRTQQNREEWKRRLVTTYGSQLDLTKGQKDRVEHIIIDVVSIDSFGRFSTEEVILATINVVVREDGRWIEDEEQFREFSEQVGITSDEGNADMGQLKTLRRMVRERVPSKSD